MTTLLIDSDILTYRAAYAGSSRHYVYKDLHTGATNDTQTFPTKKDIADHFANEYPGSSLDEVGLEFHLVTTYQPLKNCLEALEVEVDKIYSGVEHNRAEFYLSGEGNYRKDVATTLPYKGNRPPKPKHYTAVREAILKKYRATVVDGMEADDKLGIEQTKRDSTVIVSIDKDLLMIPGDHYNWTTDTHTHVTEELGERQFWTQMLTGDMTDNIMGLRGIGKKRAERYLNEVQGDVCVAVLDSYLHHPQYDNQEQAFNHFMENADLLWIGQHNKERWSLTPALVDYIGTDDV